eukprot:TRINITY_DN594_c0_g4_i1.p1 TRINITY_DN594_c0_g4~~TRINITY_DN594_c0_g4_i1.p1  ORF type:complete len:200 (-),score=52.34 TRINITY_DN594_c0_g4_i1:54-653(-)
MSGCTINEKYGDLFSTNDEALAHCVSRDLVMSKGIAVFFKKYYQNVRELEEQNIKIGGCGYLFFEDGKKPENYIENEENEEETDDKPKPHTHIFYLVTKEKYFNKPTYKSIRASLLSMRDIIVEKGIKHISIPLIGCGLDRLRWTSESPRALSVKKILEEVFEEVDISITVYKYKPPAQPRNNNNNNNRKKKSYKKKYK